MKKGTILGIVCACMALLGLAGIAIFVTYQAGDILNNEPSSAEKQADDLLEALQPIEEEASEKADNTKKPQKEEKKEEAEADVEETEETKTVAAATKNPSYIWVGDSRTIGMRDAMDNDDIYIGAAGEGYDWFMAEGLKSLTKTLEQYPSLPVIFNFGVNDYCNMHSYLAVYKAIEQDHTSNTFYYLGIYPIDPEACQYTNNEEIQDFNAHLKESFNDRYMDSYTYLMENEVETVDGIHYSEEAYRDLYQFAVKQIA